MESELKNADKKKLSDQSQRIETAAFPSAENSPLKNGPPKTAPG